MRSYFNKLFMFELLFSFDLKLNKMEKNIKSDGWPIFLNKNVLDVIDQDFKFKSMTPVQVIIKKTINFLEK
jgi:hypothetical protein